MKLQFYWFLFIVYNAMYVIISFIVAFLFSFFTLMGSKIWLTFENPRSELIKNCLYRGIAFFIYLGITSLILYLINKFCLKKVLKRETNIYKKISKSYIIIFSLIILIFLFISYFTQLHDISGGDEKITGIFFNCYQYE